MPMVLLFSTVVPVLVLIWSVKVLVLVTTTCSEKLKIQKEILLLKALNTMELWRAAQHSQGHHELSYIVSSSEPNWQRTNLIAFLWLTKGLSTHFPTAFCLFSSTPLPFYTDMWNRWHSNEIKIFMGEKKSILRQGMFISLVVSWCCLVPFSDKRFNS